MVEETTSMIEAAYAGEDDVARSRALSHDKSELFRRFERLVQVRRELLEGKCDLGKFVDEVCLILKYVVIQCFSDQDQTDTVSSDTEDFDGAKPSSVVTADVSERSFWATYVPVFQSLVDAKILRMNFLIDLLSYEDNSC
ncbi:hypothetical protein ZEAMMB73_Zm00001d042542 [Zea mays]|uniref:Uncharacterized protein n=1 Tax=Zea mays TaxID=4577 RepID=A0A1D6N537_MAIZE|nr:hypothetical protein ZEAMMB73_Zm00001d042542 [Zea mays]